MATYAFAAPIIPGKVDEWKAFDKQLAGEKRSDYAASCKRAGLTRVAAFLQRSPNGDLAVIVVESPGDPAQALRKFLEGTEPFDRWFAERIEAIYGVSAAAMAKMPPNAQDLDWRA
ncbi:MAG: hypothetical protein WA761_03535 [Thermoplasmata archaeon]